MTGDSAPEGTTPESRAKAHAMTGRKLNLCTSSKLWWVNGWNVQNLMCTFVVSLCTAITEACSAVCGFSSRVRFVHKMCESRCDAMQVQGAGSALSAHPGAEPKPAPPSPPPKKPLPAYILFVRSRRPRLLEERADMRGQVAAQMKCLSEEWKELEASSRQTGTSVPLLMNDHANTPSTACLHIREFHREHERCLHCARGLATTLHNVFLKLLVEFVAAMRGYFVSQLAIISRNREVTLCNIVVQVGAHCC